MALRDQPYIPLYVQDILSDEKLAMCTASAHGVYFRLLCILHKQENYGKICLKQKHKQNESKYINFASILCRQMPFSEKQISDSLIELFEEGVICVTDDELFQKRMIKDGKLSEIRSKIGKTGGSNVTKQYGKKGFLYLMSDGFEKTKIGISIKPGNRLYRLRSDLKLPKYFEIKHEVPVLDMGVAEDISHDFFSDILDGEWLKGNFKDIEERFVLLEAKLKAKQEAKTKANHEYENEYEDENKEEKKGVTGEGKTPKFDFKKSLIEIGVSDKIATDWMKVRRDKKASNTETSFNQIKSQIERSNISADDCIRIAVERNWRGFESEWIKNMNHGKHSGHSEVGEKQDFLEAIASGIGRAEHQRNNSLQ